MLKNYVMLDELCLMASAGPAPSEVEFAWLRELFRKAQRKRESGAAEQLLCFADQ